MSDQPKVGDIVVITGARRPVRYRVEEHPGKRVLPPEWVYLRRVDGRRITRLEPLGDLTVVERHPGGPGGAR